eukprot:4160869-Pyramimonas_sp.AAC.1
MREAARHARDSIIIGKPNSTTAECMATRSCARATCQNDFDFATKWHLAHALAREHFGAQHE